MVISKAILRRSAFNGETVSTKLLQTDVHQAGEVNLIESTISKPSQENFQ